jgi:hypothetical protein
MPVNPSVKTCTHIKATGHTCGSPALRGERFCYFHERMIHGVPTPPKQRVHPMALIENEEGIQVALMETINAIVRNTIDLKRATLILRALSIAAHNARRVRFDRQESTMVRTIPHYPASAAPTKSANEERTSSEEPAQSERSEPKGTAQLAPPTQPPRKPPASAPSAPTVQAQAVNAHPKRE